MGAELFTREENIGFWKNVSLVVVFFTIAPITLAVSLFSLFSLKTNSIKAPPSVSPYTLQSGVRVYASLPTKLPSVGGQIGSADARPEIVRQYLESYNSPLTPLSDLIVSTADKYSLDYRLITAIAQKESSLCKLIPPGSFNCWGWGIHSEGTLGFSSFEEGIEIVSKGLRENYLDKGYSSIEDIMGKYTPLSNGSWATGVNDFMTEMQ